MKQNYELVKLKNISEQITVSFVGISSKYFCEEGKGVPFLRTTNVMSNKILLNDLKYVTEEFHNKNIKSQVKPGDILITRVGLTGQAALVPNDFPKAHAGNVIIIRLKDGIIKKYVTYFLNSNFVKRQITKYEVGGVQAVFNTKRVMELDINLPDKKTQDYVVSLLQRAEKLREQRKEANQETEKIIQALFYKLFGNPFSANGKKIKLTELCEINPKKSEVSNLPEKYNVSFIEMASVSNVGKITHMEDRPIVNVIKGFSYFKESDVLFAKITPCMENGKGAIATNLTNNIGFGSTEFHVLRPNEKVNSEWVFTLTKLKHFRREAEKNMTGTAGQKRVPKQFLENFMISIPDKENLIKFKKAFSDVIKTNKYQEQSTYEINILFDALMQKAFNGELSMES